MEITQEQKQAIKDFIEDPDVANDIQAGNWDKVYKKFWDVKLPRDNRGISRPAYLTEILLQAGIDFLPGLTIGSGYFQQTSIKEFVWPDDLKVENWSSSIFSGCKDLVKADLSKASFPSDELPSSIFRECTSLKEVKLPKNLKKIDYNSFARCSALEQIDIPETVETISDGAFSDCTSLTSIKIPDNVKLVPRNLVGYNNIFSGCRLKNIEYKGETFPNVSALVRKLRENEPKVVATKDWFRIKSHGRSLVCYEVKSGVKCNLVLDGFIQGTQAPVFFYDEKEASAFLKKNNYEINGWNVDDRDIYKAKLSAADVGFVKVKTLQGEVYVQSHKADRVGITNPKVIPS